MPLKIKAMSNNQNQQMSLGYSLAVVLIIIGGVCSIVGLCILIEWMIGLGIGIICVSSVVAYNSLTKERTRYRRYRTRRSVRF